MLDAPRPGADRPLAGGLAGDAAPDPDDAAPDPDDAGPARHGALPPPELDRPLPPLTWRDRAEDLLAGVSAGGRMAVAVAVIAVVGVVAWRLLAPPPPPPEAAIPFADAAAAGDAGEVGPAAGGPADAAAAAAVSPAAGAVAAGPGVAGGEVVVHVVGAVAEPGVQHLPAGSRVADAVAAAGGASPDADLARINLAAVATDGQQIYVLRVGEPAPPPPAGGQAVGDGPVDVNTATAAQLEELPGVGPATAEAIIAHRDRHGPFASVDDLIDVRGIGEAKLAQIRERATV
ncbi:MAG TPA: ComEA family DNA-binding protein [Acidimicrobiales bacterium]